MSSRRDSGPTVTQSGFFCLSGVQGDWQTLKDLLRNEIRGQPGWVDVLNNSSSGQTAAYFSVKSEDDADKVYYALTTKGLNGSSVGVHRFNDKTNPATLVACNCQDLYPGCPGHLAGNYADNSGVTSYLLSHVSHSFSPSSVVQHNFSAPYYATAPGYTYPVQQNTIHAGPTYLAVPYTVPVATTAYGMPSVMTYSGPQYQYHSQASVHQLQVNSTNGVVLKEARGIFISNIDQSTTQEQLEAFLRDRNAYPVSVRLPRDRRKGRGHATVRFGSASEAQNAVAILDGQMLQGKKIKVRFDKDSTTTVDSFNGPLVVNGSTQGTKRR